MAVTSCRKGKIEVDMNKQCPLTFNKATCCISSAVTSILSTVPLIFELALAEKSTAAPLDAVRNLPQTDLPRTLSLRENSEIDSQIDKSPTCPEENEKTRSDFGVSVDISNRPVVSVLSATS
jgi:hypothetical protein